jgi:hypothetical protein
VASTFRPVHTFLPSPVHWAGSTCTSSTGSSTSAHRWASGSRTLSGSSTTAWSTAR